MRFPPLKPEDWSDAQRQVAAEIVAGPRSELRGPFVPLIHSPALAAHVQRLGAYLRFGTRLPDDLLELAVLVTARRFGCLRTILGTPHRALALKAGSGADHRGGDRGSTRRPESDVVTMTADGVRLRGEPVG